MNLQVFLNMVDLVVLPLLIPRDLSVRVVLATAQTSLPVKLKEIIHVKNVQRHTLR
jgi:hypothetical protein